MNPAPADLNCSFQFSHFISYPHISSRYASSVSMQILGRTEIGAALATISFFLLNTRNPHLPNFPSTRKETSHE